MSPNTHFWLELALTFGVPFGLGLHELRSLRRDGRGSGPPRDEPWPVEPTPRGGSPCEPRRLPACLVPVPSPRVEAVSRVRERVPELV